MPLHHAPWQLAPPTHRHIRPYSPTPAVCAPGVCTRAPSCDSRRPLTLYICYTTAVASTGTQPKAKARARVAVAQTTATKPTHTTTCTCFHPNHLSHQRFLPRAAMRLNARPNGLDAGSSAHRHIPPTALLIAIKLLKQSGYSSSLSARPSSRFTAEPRPSRFLAQSASHAHRNDGIGQSPSRGTIS